MKTGKTRVTAMRAALAGFQAGMVGVLVMLVWLGFASAWYRRSFWTAANLMASNFYGQSALGRPFSFSTLSGLALYVILYSLLGAVFALGLYGRVRHGRLVLLGMLVALAWYYLWWGWLWKSVNWVIALYTHDQPMLLGHVLYGALLARFPRYAPEVETPAVVEVAPLPSEHPE